MSDFQFNFDSDKSRCLVEIGIDSDAEWVIVSPGSGPVGPDLLFRVDIVVIIPLLHPIQVRI